MRAFEGRSALLCASLDHLADLSRSIDVVLALCDLHILLEDGELGLQLHFEMRVSFHDPLDGVRQVSSLSDRGQLLKT